MISFSGAETRAQELVEERARVKAEIRSVEAEVVLEAEIQQVELLRTIEADELRLRTLTLELDDEKSARNSFEEKEECLDAELHAEAKESEQQQEELVRTTEQGEHGELCLRSELEEQACERASSPNLDERLGAVYRERLQAVSYTHLTLPTKRIV